MNLNFPILEEASSPEMIEVALAAVEYTLASSITIRDASDIKSLQHWSEKLEPFEHQVQNLITFCRRAPVALIADDVGLGKTISAGLILSELMVRKKITRALILAPKILLPQWCDELKGKFGIHARHGTGEQLSALAGSKAKVVVTTYASARNRLEELRESGFEMLILDEAHKVRNLYGTPNPPKIARALRQAISAGDYRYTLLLTATPIHNRLWDIYSLIDLLAAGRNHVNPLGSPSEFAYRYLADGKTAARQLVPGRITEFRRIVGDYMVRTSRAGSGLAFPDREVHPHRCEPGPVERELEALVRESLPRLGKLQQISLAEALMSSPSALAQQLENAVSRGGAAPSTIVAARKAKQIAESSPLGCKADHLVDVAKRLRQERPDDWRLLVFTRRVATQKAIGDVLTAMGATVGYIGGGHGATQDRDVRGFQSTPPSVNVIVSTDAGAEGVNLQAGNVVINYDLPWNPMIVEQRIGRVQRLASKHASVVITNLVVQGSVEELVVARLMEKLQLISAAIGDIEGILEVVNLDDDLEDTIGDLVLKALAGQDIEASTRKILENIERAKSLYDESKDLVAQSLGELRGMHNSGPAAPEIAEVVPRLSVQEFVMRHFQESDTVVQRPEGRLSIEEANGKSHMGTFDNSDPMLRQPSGVFGGKRITLYLPGEPEFERIVGVQSRRRSHAVAQAEVNDVEIGKGIRRWMAECVPTVAFDSFQHKRLFSRFSGTVWALVSCDVAVDRLERIVEVRSDDSGWIDTDRAEASNRSYVPRADGRLDKNSWPQAAASALASAISEDGSVRAFKEFYEARLADELRKTKGNSVLEEQVRRRFETQITAEVISARGKLSQVAEVEVSYAYPGGHTSKVSVTVDGATGELLSKLALAVCSVSGSTVPEGDLQTCAVSNVRALTHLMSTSSVSGAKMLPTHAVECQVSGDLMLASEALRSDFSSRVIAPKYAAVCAVTRRKAAIDEVETCRFTGATVHADSLAISEVSGRPFRVDQAVRSSLSGVNGHASEFTVCEVSNDTVLPTEVGKSDASGLMVRLDWLVASEKNPQRHAAKTEVVRCQATDKVLLPDETGVSGVSGKRVDKDMLIPSALSGAWALPSEMFKCEESGTSVLPAETEACSGTGKRVRRDLVELSGISGKKFLKNLLLQCPESGLLGAPEEMSVCDQTGLRVAPKELETCSITGKRVVRRLLAQCEQCNEWILRSEAARTDAGALAHPHHIATSAFSGGTYLMSDLVTCAASKLQLEPSALEGPYAGPLVAVTAACAGKEPEDASLAPLANELQGPWRGQVSRLWTRPSPRPTLKAVLVEGPRRFLRQPRRYAFFVDVETREVVGTVVTVEIGKGGYTFSPLE